MSQYSETLTVADELRDAPSAPQAEQSSGYFPGHAGNGMDEAPRPRLRFDSIAPSGDGEPPKSPMRVLLRDTKTMKFLRRGARWTKNPKLAVDFHNGWWATVCAFTMDPRHLVIHYQFEDDRYNLHIPVLGHPQTQGGGY